MNYHNSYKYRTASPSSQLWRLYMWSALRVCPADSVDHTISPSEIDGPAHVYKFCTQGALTLTGSRHSHTPPYRLKLYLCRSSRAEAMAPIAALALDQISGRAALAAGVALTAAFVAYTRRAPPKPCNICGGLGAWKCVICDGEGFMFRGRVKAQCKACVGRGKRICRECTGSGWNKKTDFIG